MSYKFLYTPDLKPVQWLGNSLDVVRGFPSGARHSVGIELQSVQRGLEPADWKPMKSIGAGVVELRVHAGAEYRVLYVAKFDEAVYVLHAFLKKTQKTAWRDVSLAEARYRSLLRGRSLR